MFDRQFYFFSFIAFLVLGLFISNARGEVPILVTEQGADLNALVNELATPYDLSETIKTLIYIESRNGLYPVNLNDPSCGVTHININTYMKRHKIQNTPFNRNKACADLLASPKWAILNAIEELEFWKKIHCGRKKCSKMQFSFVIKSYNAGWHYQSAKANEYYDKFQSARAELKRKGTL